MFVAVDEADDTDVVDVGDEVVSQFEFEGTSTLIGTRHAVRLCKEYFFSEVCRPSPIRASPSMD